MAIAIERDTSSKVSPHDPGGTGVTRRDFILASSLAATTLGLPPGATAGAATVAVPPPDSPGATTRTIRLTINGEARAIAVEPRVTLLDALRESLQLTGTKKGCDRGQCGACTVLVDGRRVNSCLILAVMSEGRAITTIEGIGNADRLHPLQAAFIARDALQCGYCTPGQICSGVGMLEELRTGTPSAVTADVRSGAVSVSPEEIRERMSGNLCRCGAYTNIVDALLDVALEGPGGHSAAHSGDGAAHG